MKKKILNYCLICKKEIFRKNNVHTSKERRSKYAVTCSRDCSRIYQRIRIHVLGRKYNMDVGLK